MSASPSTGLDDKRLTVLKAATAVFLEHGFSAATTDMIQRAAGISKATVYACFPSKEALFAAVIERECAAMAATIREIGAAPGGIAETLTDIGMSYLEKVVLSPTGQGLHRIVTSAAPRFPELGRTFYRTGPKAAVSAVAARLSEAERAGQIDVRAVGVDAAATLFISMVRGQGQLEALTHPARRASAARMAHWVHLAVTTFLSAFGTRPG